MSRAWPSTLQLLRSPAIRQLFLCALHNCGSTILFPGLSDHQITWLQAYPNGLLAAVRELHSDLCNDTPGEYVTHFCSCPGPFPSPVPNLAQANYLEGYENPKPPPNLSQHLIITSFRSRSGIPPHRDGTVRKRLFDWTHELPLNVHRRAVPHSNAVSGGVGEESWNGTMRQRGPSVTTTLANIGSILSPRVGMTSELYPSLPLFIYGAVLVAACPIT
eukprot:bmy_20657T0